MPIKVTANGKTFTFPDGTSHDQIGAAVDEYFGKTTSAPAAPKPKQQEISGWQKFTDGVGAGIGTTDRAAAWLKMAKSKPGSKDYLEGKAELERLGMADTSDGSWQSIAGKAIGGGLVSILDTLTGGGVSETGSAADEYLRQATGTEAAKMAAARKYGTAVGLANAVGMGVGQGPTRLLSGAKQAAGNVLTGVVPELEMGRQPTADSMALDAIVGGALGAITHSKPKPALSAKEIADIEAETAAILGTQTKPRAEAEAAANKARNKDLEPRNIDAVGPRGMQYEMKLPEAKETKAGKAQARERLKAKGQPLPDEELGAADPYALSPEEKAAQLDMFVEDNRKVVEDNMFRSALEQSQAAAAAESRKLIEQARLLEEQARTNEALSAQQRNDYVRRAGELFDEAAAREAHAQRVFDSNLRASADAEAQRSQGLVEDAALQEQGVLDREAADRRVFQRNLEQSQLDAQRQSADMMAARQAQELARQQVEHAREMDRQRELWAPRKKTPEITEPTGTRVGDSYTPDSQLPLIGESPYGKPVQSLATRDAELKISGEAAARNMVDQYGNPLRDSLPIETTPTIVPETAPFWKTVETEKAWAQHNTKQEMDRIASWMQGVREQARARGLEAEWNALEAKLLQEPSPNYGMGRVTREFQAQQALELSARRRKSQGGYIDPTVFADAAKKAMDFAITVGRNFGKFIKTMIDAFGNIFSKRELRQLHDESNKKLDAHAKTKRSLSEKYGTAFHNVVKASRNPEVKKAFFDIESTLADVRANFRTLFYGEQYDASPFGSGSKWHEGGLLARLFKDRTVAGSMLKKYAPYFNSDRIISPKEMGMTPAEQQAWNALRQSMNELGRKLGVDITANPNYMPRMRLGEQIVVARDADGNLHVEAAKDVTRRKLLERKLKQAGYSVVKSGPRSVLETDPIVGGYIANDYIPSHSIIDPASAHLKEANNIAGYTGQRTPEDFLDVLPVYADRVEKQLMKEAVQERINFYKDKLPTDYFNGLVEHVDKSLGAGFVHTPQFTRDVDRAVRSTFGLEYLPSVMGTASTLFYAMKVSASGVNLVQGLLSPIQALTELHRAGFDEGINVPKAEKHIAQTVVRALFNRTTERERYIADRAIAAGYIQNPADIADLGHKMGRDITTSHIIDTLKDVSRGGRLETKIRKDFFVGMYNYFVQEKGLDSKAAFHEAGKHTQNAFVGIRQQDRAAWTGWLGQTAQPFAALTTYPIGMAGQLTSLIGRHMTKGQLAGLVTLVGASTIAAGLRGSPVADLAEMGNAFANMLRDEDEKTASFDSMLLRWAEQNPKYAWGVNGVISEGMGVDVSRSIGQPSPMNLIPFYNQLKPSIQEGVAAMTGGEAPPTQGIAPPVVQTLAKMGKSGYDLIQQQLGNKTLTPQEKQVAKRDLSPRFLSRMGEDGSVYQGEKFIGKVSPEAQAAAEGWGARSLEEAYMKANEATAQVRDRAKNEFKRNLVTNIVKDALFSKEGKVNMEKYKDKMDHLQKLQVPISDSDVISEIMRQYTNAKTTGMGRAAINMDVVEMAIRMQMQEELQQSQQQPTE